jgi:hypothetical protein
LNNEHAYIISKFTRINQILKWLVVLIYIYIYIYIYGPLVGSKKRNVDGNSFVEAGLQLFDLVLPGTTQLTVTYLQT